MEIVSKEESQESVDLESGRKLESGSKDDVEEEHVPIKVSEENPELHPETMRGQATMACQGWSLLYNSIRSAVSGAMHGTSKESAIEE